MSETPQSEPQPETAFLGSDSESHSGSEQDDVRLLELVGFLAQGLVTHPEDVEVEEYFDDIGTVYGVRVHPEDVGRMIGKDGRVANALRHVVKAAATKTGAHVMVEIVTDDSLQKGENNEENGQSETQENPR